MSTGNGHAYAIDAQDAIATLWGMGPGSETYDNRVFRIDWNEITHVVDVVRKRSGKQIATYDPDTGTLQLKYTDGGFDQKAQQALRDAFVARGGRNVAPMRYQVPVDDSDDPTSVEYDHSIKTTLERLDVIDDEPVALNVTSLHFGTDAVATMSPPPGKQRTRIEGTVEFHGGPVLIGYIGGWQPIDASDVDHHFSRGDVLLVEQDEHGQRQFYLWDDGLVDTSAGIGRSKDTTS